MRSRLTAKELVEIGQKLYGRRGWQTAMAAALKVDTSTIRRWIYADSVPGPAAAALQCFDAISITVKGVSDE
jgi:hypothetical protein